MKLLKKIDSISSSNTKDLFNIPINPIDFMNNLHSNLTPVESLIVTNLIGFTVIFATITSIISILFGDVLIKYFELEHQFPRLATILHYRSKMTKYSLIYSFGSILIFLILLAYINILVFTIL